MATIVEHCETALTVEDLCARFGPIALGRICLDPPPGTATEGDVVRIHDQQDRLCELADGVLVEKTMGAYESYLAVEIACLIRNFVVERQLGIVFGADGMMRLCPGLVRIPDVSFISWRQLPDHKVPRTAMAYLAPDLAVEVISKWNTPREMDRKLADYFSAGVRLAWYVYPDKREVHVYRSPENPLVLREGQAVEGGDVLPGFSVLVKALFPE